ncbi:LOW QUALITY PROTEIN: uncharacterized protein ACNLHF_009243 [Anomaloglossus baeobatrachus]
MECRLPEDKLTDLRYCVQRALEAKKIRLRDLQSLLGKLNFACRILPMGRVFSRRLAQATAGVSHPLHFIRLKVEHKADLRVWSRFLQLYNGRSLWLREVVSSDELVLYTDVAGSSGFGAYFGGRWCVGKWPESWRISGLTRNLALLELFPIVVLWGQELRDRKVRFMCDNLGVVQCVNKLIADSPPVVDLLRHMVLQCLELNLFIWAVHVPGVLNSVAGALSRFQWDRFRVLALDAEQQETVWPIWLWDLVCGQPGT